MDLGNPEQGTEPLVDQAGTCARKRQRGFTLIELMVVVAIIGILASIGIPVFMNFVRQARTTDAVNNMSSMANSINALLGMGRNVAQIQAAFGANGLVEDPIENAAGSRAISRALASTAWTVASNTMFRYTAQVVANVAGTGLDICISAAELDAANVANLAAAPGWVYFTSPAPLANDAGLPDWTGNVATGGFITPGTPVRAAGACGAVAAAGGVSAVVAR